MRARTSLLKARAAGSIRDMPGGRGTKVAPVRYRTMNGFDPSPRKVGAPVHVDCRTSSFGAVVTAPSVFDRAYAAVFRAALMPTWERVVRRRETLNHLRYLARSQWFSPEEHERRGAAALRELLAYAGSHVPYYRETFAKYHFDPRSVRRRSDIEALPLLTRELVRERYQDLVDPAHRDRNLKKGTSGSTGTPLKFEYSMASECWRQATKLRGYGWAGYRPGLKTFYYWAFVSGAEPSLKIRIDRALRRETFVDSMRQDDEARREALSSFQRTRPNVVVCYTQSCAQFARWILDEGLRNWDDVPVICGAEAVLPGDRAVLARAFGPDIFETYGSRETMLMAAECEAHDGMHVQEENLLLEVVRGGRAVGPGAAGDVVVTDLHNYGMPLIRYVNGDVATTGASGTCACGRGLARIGRVDGRRASAIVDRDGNAVPGIVFHVLFSDARRELVRQFQAVQSATGDVRLKVVRGKEFDTVAFQSVVQRFGEYLRGLPFSVEFHESIPPHVQSGKIQTIVVEGQCRDGKTESVMNGSVERDVRAS